MKIMAKKQIEQTEIEAPYELPEGWKWGTIEECCEMAFTGKSPKYSKEITPYKLLKLNAFDKIMQEKKMQKF